MRNFFFLEKKYFYLAIQFSSFICLALFSKIRRFVWIYIFVYRIIHFAGSLKMDCLLFIWAGEQHMQARSTETIHSITNIFYYVSSFEVHCALALALSINIFYDFNLFSLFSRAQFSDVSLSFCVFFCRCYFISFHFFLLHWCVFYLMFWICRRSWYCLPRVCRAVTYAGFNSKNTRWLYERS